MSEPDTFARDRLPLVALVGRPNVGKSRLFNRLTRTRSAIVEDTPGVTRDRHYGETSFDGQVFNLVDTGGFEPDAKDELLAKMREQAELAIAEADVVVLLLDAREGLVAADWDLVELLRRSDKRVIYAVNKIDGPKQDPLLLEFHELGVEPIVPISAEHGGGIEELMVLVTVGFPTEEERQAARDAWADEPTRVAVIGRPNVGKSTLVNQLLGEARLLTSDTPGTTRDAIDSDLILDGQRFTLIDTAGVRRRRSIHLALEKYSVMRAFESIDRAEVILLLIDAVEGPTDQDARLLGLALDKGRALVLLVNKWDLIDKETNTAHEYTKALRSVLHFCNHAPIEFISALTGKRAHRVLPTALVVRHNWRRRISTSQLNQFLARALARNQPPIHRNRRVKLFYMSQLRTAPPTFAVICNYPAAVPAHYRRYLENRLREAFDFSGTPVRIRYRMRSRRPDTRG